MSCPPAGIGLPRNHRLRSARPEPVRSRDRHFVTTIGDGRPGVVTIRPCGGDASWSYAVPLKACLHTGRGKQMHDRTVTPKPSVGEPPELKGVGRDLRIDACRGIALW